METKVMTQILTKEDDNIPFNIVWLEGSQVDRLVAFLSGLLCLST